MPELTLDNIRQISNDVRKQEITFSHLADELIDHICCDVESEMGNGYSFSDAYQAVRNKMGHRRLKEIQEETLFAVDKKYRKMKNTMKITGVAGTVMLGFAALFKIMHWPMAGIMLVLGSLLLAFVFTPSALSVLWKETHSGKRIFLYVAAFIEGMLFIMAVVFKIQHWPAAGLFIAMAAFWGSFVFIPVLLAGMLRNEDNRTKKAIYIIGASALILCALGMLFKIQHYPMAGLFFMSGTAVLFFIVFPWYTLVTWKNEKNIDARFIFLMTGSLAIIIPLALINLNIQRNYEKGFFLNQHEQQALFRYLYNKNQSSIKHPADSLAAPVLSQIGTQTDRLLGVIYDIEGKMISVAEGNPDVPSGSASGARLTETGPEVPYESLHNPFLFTFYLQGGTEPKTQLDEAMKAYSEYLSGIMTGHDQAYLNNLLNPETYFPDNYTGNERVSLMSGLHMLALLKNGILTAESYALEAVAENTSHRQ